MKYEHNHSSIEYDENKCAEYDIKPLERFSCNLSQCGFTIARVIYPIHLRYEDVTFNSKIRNLFLKAFVTEISNALGQM